MFRDTCKFSRAERDVVLIPSHNNPQGNSVHTCLCPQIYVLVIWSTLLLKCCLLTGVTGVSTTCAVVVAAGCVVVVAAGCVVVTAADSVFVAAAAEFDPAVAPGKVTVQSLGPGLRVCSSPPPHKDYTGTSIVVDG
jgi:hypothetical protein